MSRFESLPWSALCHSDEFASGGAARSDCSLREMPDLPILDLRMPTMNGIEFLKKWKAGPGFADTRFIIMTFETGRDLVEEDLPLGMPEYIAKASNEKTLVSRLLQHVFLRRRVVVASAPQTSGPVATMQTAPPPPQPGFWRVTSRSSACKIRKIPVHHRGSFCTVHRSNRILQLNRCNFHKTTRWMS